MNRRRSIQSVQHKLRNNSMEMDEYWAPRIHKQSHMSTDGERDKEVIYLQCTKQKVRCNMRGWKRISNLMYCFRARDFSFFAFFLFSCLAGWLPVSASFLVQTLLDVSWISTSCFPISSVWQRTRKFYPIYELQFILALRLCRSFYTNTCTVYCVRGALKFVVNGFLMQILCIVYSIWPIVNNTHFHIQIFMFVWGLLFLMMLLLRLLLLLLPLFGVVVLFAIEINHSTL